MKPICNPNFVLARLILAIAWFLMPPPGDSPDEVGGLLRLKAHHEEVAIMPKQWH